MTITKTLIIIRGLPNSGKTTFAELMGSPWFPILSADQYFERNEGYIFKPELLPRAHFYCKVKTEKVMRHGYNRVFVANTFTTEVEIQPYIDLANKYNYRVFRIIVERTHSNTNDHNVPQSTIDKMKGRFSIKL